MDFQNCVTNFLENRKNANIAVDLVNYLEAGKSDILPCIEAVENLFVQLFERGDFEIDSTLRLSNPKAYDLEKQYLQWLNELYESSVVKLLKILESDDCATNGRAIECICNFIAAETSVLFKECKSFSVEKLKKLIKKILLTSTAKNDLVNLFTPFLANRDVLLYSWKVLREIVPATNRPPDVFTNNLLLLLPHMILPKTEESTQMLFYKDAELLKHSSDQIKKSMQKVWEALTNRSLNPATHRKLLVVLVEHYLSQLNKPTILTDFLMGSLAMGGATSLLALQAMSVLVTKHNLECPDIFGKLYGMLTPELFDTRYKARLFHLADLFLRSTYVSEQLVAAFAKRLSRLSLVAHSCDLVLMMQFIGNILIRHPALKVMIDSPTPSCVEEDPFDMSESDPVKSRALESSLWEITLLKNHVQPKVAAAAKFIDNNMPALEWDFHQLLDSSYAKMFESEIKKNVKIEPALTFERPSKLAKLSEDRVCKLWQLT